MPSTLAHIGIQTLVTRAVIRGADVKWIWAGCVIPDLPWIGQRAARVFAPDLSVYEIRLYAIVQSSLLFCLVLSAALACFSDRPRRVFTILALGCLMHLALDALQTKWANGVHLFAPVSWELLNFGLFWPEDPPTWIMTGLGLTVAGYAALRIADGRQDLMRPKGWQLAALLTLMAIYLAGPVFLRSGPLATNNHYVTTLMAVQDRPGRSIAIDRNRVIQAPEGAVLLSWTRERLALDGELPTGTGKLSLKGRFRDPDTIVITAAHAHPSGIRDMASYLGLALVMLWWGHCLLRPNQMHLGR